MVVEVTEQGEVFTVNVRHWDQEFEAWKNNSAPLNDPNFPVPANHPWDKHPWNQGIEG